MSLKTKDRQYIDDCIENEGFGYAFTHYSDFKQVTDKEFHRLREKFLEAQAKLADYIGVDP